MTKRQVIDNILEVNASADPEFLSQFEHEDLTDYLRKLHTLAAPRLTDGGAAQLRAADPVTTFKDLLPDVEPATAAEADLAACPATTRPSWREQHLPAKLDLDIAADVPAGEIDQPHPEPVPVGVFEPDQADKQPDDGPVRAAEEPDQMAWLF